MGRQRGREWWRKLYDEQRRTGLPKAALARREGISANGSTAGAGSSARSSRRQRRRFCPSCSPTPVSRPPPARPSSSCRAVRG